MKTMDRRIEYLLQNSEMQPYLQKLQHRNRTKSKRRSHYVNHKHDKDQYYSSIGPMD